MDELVVVYFQPVTIVYVSALTSSRVTPRGIIGWQTGGFLAQSGSRYAQQNAGMEPMNRTLDTNKILELFFHFYSMYTAGQKQGNSSLDVCMRNRL